MMSSSPYFQALLGPNFLEGNSKGEIVLYDITGDTLLAIIEFYTTGEVKLAASTMNLMELESLCSDFLGRNLTVNNFSNRLMTADLYTLPSLRKKVIDFLSAQFNKIPKLMLMLLSISHFTDLMGSERIAASSEEEIFNCIEEYIERNCGGFDGVESKLLASVNLKCLTKTVCYPLALF